MFGIGACLGIRMEGWVGVECRWRGSGLVGREYFAGVLGGLREVVWIGRV